MALKLHASTMRLFNFFNRILIYIDTFHFILG